MSLNLNDLTSFEVLLEREISKLKIKLQQSTDFDEIECLISEIIDYEMTLEKVKNFINDSICNINLNNVPK